jgi:hypothetical protein
MPDDAFGELVLNYSSVCGFVPLGPDPDPFSGKNRIRPRAINIPLI